MARVGVSQTLNIHLEWPKLAPMSWAYKIVNRQSGFFTPIQYQLTRSKYRCTVNGIDHGVEVQNYSDFEALVISKAGSNLYRIIDDQCGETTIDGKSRVEIRICVNNEKLVWEMVHAVERFRYRNPVVKGSWVPRLGTVVLRYGIRNDTALCDDIETFIKMCRRYNKI